MQPTLNRRAVLGGGVLLALAWAGAQLAGHWPSAGPPSPTLGPGARRALEAALEVMLPDPAMASAVAGDVDAAVASDPVGAAQLAMALRTLEHLGGAGPTRFRRFSLRGPDERRAILAAWSDSRLGIKRQVFAGLRRLAAFAWYSRPQSWEAIGYDGPWVSR